MDNVNNAVDNSEDRLRERREWFDAYFTRINAGIQKATKIGARYNCPCCGYPTLDERGGYQICQLCYWEDDGQDDPHADEIWGGPNKGYSLTRARENFKRYWIMYEPDQDSRIGGSDSELELTAKKDMVRAFDTLIHARDEEQDRLWEIIAASRRMLSSELKRKIAEYSNRRKR
jgi:hypothetical protein